MNKEWAGVWSDQWAAAIWNIHECICIPAVRLVDPVRRLNAGEFRLVGVAGQAGNTMTPKTYFQNKRTFSSACPPWYSSRPVCLSSHDAVWCPVHEGGHRYSRRNRKRARERGQRWRASDSLRETVSDEKWTKPTLCINALTVLSSRCCNAHYRHNAYCITQ